MLQAKSITQLGDQAILKKHIDSLTCTRIGIISELFIFLVDSRSVQS
ncbi:hypothetical protein SynBIOSU31_02729 [Synechococcus sp. BIOS-U3-1]|nr:hypothetical protein SynBIOSU31_02729 [Synechococcus sp. BIOS-U3-1]